MHPLLVTAVVGFLGAIGAPARTLAKPVNFTNDVVPVLTRAGCNQGACHGAAAGKNGFKLSLRGFAPELDYQAIARHVSARRISLADPESSLLLLKPMLKVAHRGGLALSTGTPEYAILLQWIREGAHGPEARDPHVTSLTISPPRVVLLPGHDAKFRTVAQFSDGTTRDVTHWTRFGSNDVNVASGAQEGVTHAVANGETAFTAAYQDKVAFATVSVPFPNKIKPSEYAALPRLQPVDAAIYDKLRQMHVAPSPVCDDRTFCRRLRIDMTGTLPSPEEVAAFVSDKRPNKRALLIDSLLTSRDGIDFWTYKWCDLLRVNRSMMKNKGVWAFYAWVHQAVEDNKPWHQLVAEVLTATGNTFMDGPANYFRSAQTPQELAENVGQAFMGVRIQCARCHNHPLEKWTQNDYYGMASIFARVGRKVDNSIWVNDEMSVYNQSAGDVEQPRLGRPLPPRPLGGPALALDAADDRRAFLAGWLGGAGARSLARPLVNRVWAQFMGRGLVEPVDDMRETNPPTNAAALDLLTAQFIKSGFDVRALIRSVASSGVYQLASTTNARNRQDDRWYSHYLVRRLTAEQLLDAISTVTGKPEAFSGVPAGVRAIQLPDTKTASEFMDTFGRPARQITCECERSQDPGLSQTLLLINGASINSKLAADGGLADRLAGLPVGDEVAVNKLYETAVGRPATAAELVSGLAAMKRAKAGAPPAGVAKARRAFLEDLLWALTSSKEFLFNH